MAPLADSSPMTASAHPATNDFARGHRISSSRIPTAARTAIPHSASTLKRAAARMAAMPKSDEYNKA
jgi:hypothetical protein